MKKYICFIIHTEDLHNEKTWSRVRKLLKFFGKFNVKASWFSVNPTFVGYQAMNFDEKKWQERLKVLIENNQLVEQHTHFYKGEQGVPKGRDYDLSPDHVVKRIREDRGWLESQGFKVSGFISGAWKINEEILKILSEEGYQYDLSTNNLDLKQKVSIEKINGLLEIPATGNIKRLFWDLLCLRFKRRALAEKETVFYPVHFHDFDLKSLNYWILLYLVLFFSFFNFKFISVKEIYQQIT